MSLFYKQGDDYILVWLEIGIGRKRMMKKGERGRERGETSGMHQHIL
jgi:hypothetical protein